MVAVVAVVVAIHVRALVPAVCPVQRHVLQRGLFILCWLGFGPTVRKFAVASGAGAFPRTPSTVGWMRSRCMEHRSFKSMPHNCAGPASQYAVIVVLSAPRPQEHWEISEGLVRTTGGVWGWRSPAA